MTNINKIPNASGGKRNSKSANAISILYPKEWFKANAFFNVFLVIPALYRKLI